MNKEEIINTIDTWIEYLNQTLFTQKEYNMYPCYANYNKEDDNMPNPNREYNKELILAHEFIKEQYTNYMNNNKLKSNDERRAYAHAVKVTGDIAYNCDITDKPNPKHKPEFYNTVYDD